MKKLIKVAVVSMVAVSVGTAAPAYAGKDGESGYALGCLIGWWVFGLKNTCGEL
ncbi:hypothetical protein [Porphyrobacter sp. ULC335]|jgi:hypothetical protein|uniref:hypothetical protein n=1 Tax=Porphyrobacter sp. ULC335 TaxID=2854260 RepID=UPI00222030DD|nr:hypothetical protein [Porphyrobacter sp. ULC335]UYV16339.1 hypothetical protein KVF90_03115 [Porphyrobacter sp. ULC335]